MKIKKISFYHVESKYRDKTLPDLRDMLRYDVAFQSRSNPDLIAFPAFQTKQGTLGGAITVGRWDSFGVRLKPVGRNEEDILTIHSIFPDEWLTYRHPRSANGPYDYTKLVAVSLATYRNAKDPDAIDATATAVQS